MNRRKQTPIRFLALVMAIATITSFSFRWFVMAIEISVDRELRDEVKVSLYDLDVFHTPAEDVIRFMKQFGPCIHDEPDEQLSTEYEFPALGIRFWRERAFHEKLLQDRAYVEAMQLVLEEEKRYLYFDIVTVKI